MQKKSEEYMDYLAEAFTTEANKENDKLSVLALAAGAAIWGFSGNAIAGIALGGCILLLADKGVRRSNRALEMIQRNQIAAPFLKADDFQDFRRVFGEELTLQQLKQAHEYGLPIQAIAADYLYQQCPELEQPKALKDTAGMVPSLLGSTQPAPQTTEELLHRLQAECPELLLLVKAPPIRLVGLQRTGKSTFARKLALLRAVLIPGHRLLWATPHKEADNPVPAALNPIGTKANGSKDFAAIEAAWEQTQQEIDAGRSLNLTAVWDEFGSYDQFNEPDCLGKSLRSLLREASKHDYFPIVIAHGDQASFYPGVTNILKTLQQSTVKVETIGEKADEFGTMRPTGEIEITWLDGSKVRFQVPEWLSMELLLKLLPQPPIAQEPQPTAAPQPNTARSPREQLENSYRLIAPDEFPPTSAPQPEAVDPLKVKIEALPDIHQSILRYLVSKGGELPVAAIKQNWGKNHGFNAEQVEEFLIDLIDLRLIETFSPPGTKAEWIKIANLS